MIRLLHGNKPLVRAIEVSLGVFTPDTICTNRNEREARRCGHGGNLGIDMRHGGATLSESESQIIYR